MNLSRETNEYVEQMFTSLSKSLSEQGITLHPKTRELHNALVARCEAFATPPNCAVLYGGKEAETLWSKFSELDPKRAVTQFQPIQATEGAKWLEGRQRLFADELGNVVGLSRNEEKHLWRVASCCYADMARGQVTAVTMDSTPQSVSQRDELYVAMKNQNVTHINGLERVELVTAWREMSQRGFSREDVTQAVTDRLSQQAIEQHSGVQTHASKQQENELALSFDARQNTQRQAVGHSYQHET